MNTSKSALDAFNKDEIKATDKKILAHLSPIRNGYADTYLCYISKYSKDDYIYSVAEKVKAWVERNGGRYEQISGKTTIGERKGFVVRIVFPMYNKRDMKNVMATLFYD